jgi:hypothetical protein
MKFQEERTDEHGLPEAVPMRNSFIPDATFLPTS